MIVTYVYPTEAENWEGVEWRCNMPARAINRTGVHKANVITDVDFSYHSDRCITSCLESDVIVIYKKIYGRTISAIHHWQARDKTIIVDFDEAYQLLDKHSDDYLFWFEGMQRTKENNLKFISPAPMTQFKWGLKLVDGITVSSERLANDWISFNEIAVVPNYIALESYTAPKSKRKNGNFVIGWHGNNEQLCSLKDTGALDAIEKILDHYPDITFTIHIDDQYEKNFESLNHSQIKIIENICKNDWLEALTKIDIGIIPLNGQFDQRKAMRTSLEFMVMKIPWLGSQKTIFHDAETISSLVDNSSDSWYEKLLEVIIHYDGYKEFALQEPFFFGIGKSADENIGKTINTYKKIIAAKRR
jgi:hypothetical protein